MSISKSNTEQRSADEPSGPSRKRLAIETVCLGWLAAAITSTIQTLIWDREERLLGTLEKYHWTPNNYLLPILVCMPFGFIIHTLFPWGWLFWLGFGSTLCDRSRAFIIIAVAGAILFGLVWPKHFVMMMGI